MKRVKPSQHPERPNAQEVAKRQIQEPKAEQLNRHDIEIVPTRPESARKGPELVHAEPAATWISLRNALGFVAQHCLGQSYAEAWLAEKLRNERIRSTGRPVGRMPQNLWQECQAIDWQGCRVTGPRLTLKDWSDRVSREVYEIKLCLEDLKAEMRLEGLLSAPDATAASEFTESTSRQSAVSPATPAPTPKKRSRKKSIYKRSQETRAREVLGLIFEDQTYPLKEDIHWADLWDKICTAYKVYELKKPSKLIPLPELIESASLR
jgi:hypothetical protein